MHPEFSVQTSISGKNNIYKNAHIISNLICAEDNMVNISPKGVLDYMKHGLATWLEDKAGNVGGFIKAVPWHPNLTQVAGDLAEMEKVAIQNMEQGIIPTGFESGSLLIPEEFRHEGLGSQLKNELAVQIIENYPDIPLFSVVAKENLKSIGLNQKLGWIALNENQIKTFTELLGIDVLQGWDAHIFLHPNCMKLLHQDN
jgi:hypothetical protein